MPARANGTRPTGLTAPSLRPIGTTAGAYHGATAVLTRTATGQPATPAQPATQAQPATLTEPATPPSRTIPAPPARWQHPITSLRSAAEGHAAPRSVAAWYAALRSAAARHPWLRYLQIAPVALVLWGTDDVDRFRAGAAAAGLRNAVAANAISRELGGGFAVTMNNWLAVHPAVGSVAAWYYIVLQGAVTGIIGVVLIWRRVPSFGLHRNALIACNVIGLVAFWLYPVAPPRMLAGYHDIAARAAPIFSSILEGKAADDFAATPSLHVAWAFWVAIAAGTLFRRPALKAVLWLYPAATIIDVLATANHYLLDAITAVGVVLIAYAIALSPALARRLRQRQAAPG